MGPGRGVLGGVGTDVGGVSCMHGWPFASNVMSSDVSDSWMNGAGYWSEGGGLVIGFCACS